MNKSQVTSNKTQIEYLDQALDTLYLPPSEEIMEQAQTMLIQTLENTKDEAILYGKLEHSIISELFIAIRKKQIVVVNFGVTEDDFLQKIEKQFNSPIYFAPDETNEAIQQVRDYLNGQRITFDLPTNISIMTEFQQQVLKATQQIPRGKIATYMDIARRIGNPKAVRAVGQALGRNPIPIVIPCHRVIASNGTLGGYSGGGGLETKVKLLKLEGALSL